MRGPTAEMMHRAEVVELLYHKAFDKLFEHIKLFLHEDMIHDDANRNKEYLRDRYIVPRMKRLRRGSVMISDTEGVRLDRALQLSRNREKAERQVRRLRRLMKALPEMPEPVSEETVTNYALTPEFKNWLKSNIEASRRVQGIIGIERLCPIREDKEHKGEIRAECER